MKKIGVLALQGAFIEHIKMIKLLGHEAIPIRKAEQLGNLDGIILPGGESTAIGKLMREFDLKDRMIELIKNGIPVWGTCAGLILLAEKIKNDPIVHLGTMNITAVRNSYGRQLGSFVCNGKIKGIEGEFPMVFIRAPHIERVGQGVSILAEIDDQIVAAQQDNMLVTSFHPELTEDLRMHQYFINMIS
ncbi:pyridoxal 5'-phosphate synthase glutaminase subunit PdxT [Marinisporobacter balticus]|uniref:Pyridoxal 5'-phosphate synthase subunit PdxT n=1 Tax=Marinisporobacter balticus TaxID=2018667 RepID=A0A4R2KVU7_9FIRM|nr:pyridoxal 5'-phosphate synthase glutaminase subunit PdxT [Marinisporobacter balticus]TCO76957.1 pyridoxal phosphate synthase yaaE subunit [Marinisporobacter balticus]